MQKALPADRTGNAKEHKVGAGGAGERRQEDIGIEWKRNMNSKTTPITTVICGLNSFKGLARWLGS